MEVALVHQLLHQIQVVITHLEVFQLFQLLHQQVVDWEVVVLLVVVLVQQVVLVVEVDLQVMEAQVIHLLHLQHKVRMVVIQLILEEEAAEAAVVLVKPECLVQVLVKVEEVQELQHKFQDQQ